MAASRLTNRWTPARLLGFALLVTFGAAGVWGQVPEPSEAPTVELSEAEQPESSGVQITFLTEELFEPDVWAFLAGTLHQVVRGQEGARLALLLGGGSDLLEDQWYEAPGGSVLPLSPAIATSLLPVLGGDGQILLCSGQLVVYLPSAPDASVEEADPRIVAAEVSAISAALRDVAELDIVLLPPIDQEAVELEDAADEAAGRPLRFAVANPIEISPADGGTWEMLDSETVVWRLRIISPGALSLNLGFERYHMPAGGSLYIYATDQSYLLRPFTARDNQEHGQLWTPVVLSDDILVTAVVPMSVIDELELELTWINHGYRFFGEPVNRSGDRHGTCHIDVVCPDGNNWRSEIPAIGVYSKSGPSGSRICTGCMINNTARNQTPYFLTANHCEVTAGNAASVVVYWNYQSPTCGQQGGGTLNQSTSGATFRAGWGGSGTSDFTLLQLSSQPNASYGVTFAGWNRGTGNPSSAVCIHHPQCHEKSISFENNACTTTSYYGTSSPGDGTHLRVADWDSGSTEPGSSGAPLFDQNRRIVGQLHGGDAACGNDLADWFGRLSVSWAGGGTNATRLSNWLDPNNTGATTMDPPIAPPSISASDGTYCNWVQVSWNAVSGATGYAVWRSTSQSGTYQNVGGSNGLTYNDLTAVPGTTYWYKVRANDQWGMPSGFSNVDSGRRDVTLAPPTGMTASDGTYCSYVQVKWNAVSGASGYKVYRSTSATGTYSLIGSPTGTSFNDTGASGNTTYYYKVQATKTTGCTGGDFSAYDTGWRPSGVPGAPTGVAASDGTYCDKIRVTWNSVSWVTGYEVYRSTSASGTYSKIGTSATNSFDDKSATAGVTYYYKVKATNGCGTSGFSAYDSGKRKVCQ